MTTMSMQFSPEDFYLPRFFKPFISKILLPDGIIYSRIDRMVEALLNDFEGEQSLICIMLSDHSNKFYREFQKRLLAKCGKLQVYVLTAKETIMRCMVAPTGSHEQWSQQMMHSWQIRDHKQQETIDKASIIQNNNVILVTSLTSTGNSISSLHANIQNY